MKISIEEITEDKKNTTVECVLSRSRGKLNKTLVVETDILTKVVKFIVLDEEEVEIFDNLEDAVNLYNAIQ
ncbi:hypothetical protein [Poseidonibacter ostreae]|uniref:Uncharacterized protein n=1 Tax=Poseidonibacter ostreae TaxID=2654171 RepID=A0A6L4WY61_9BACT|nr:hypothetical protein [Poseidonibacter ostreae]KAB7891410.1 hypothetical protein GBG19_00810 [Poseidonibacter ostreae]